VRQRGRETRAVWLEENGELLPLSISLDGRGVHGCFWSRWRVSDILGMRCPCSHWPAVCFPYSVAAALNHFPFPSAPHSCHSAHQLSTHPAPALAPVPFSNVSEQVLATSAAGHPSFLCALCFCQIECNCVLPGSSARVHSTVELAVRFRH
jgi:hypothetical protein